ncbi:MAG: hypothetical protein KJO83_07740 [Bacteroidia bacterium]|nr:hypothetical protein [Bacteroidia bacterium]
MKTTFFRYSVLILLTGFLINTNSLAQENDADNYKMLFRFKTVKQHDNSRLLEVSFIGQNKEDRKDKLPIYDAEIKFYNISGDNEALLGAAKTNKEGIANITLPVDQSYLNDEDGFINFTARFEGSDALDEEEDEILIKDLFLELNLAEIDSVKTVLVKANLKDSLGVETPVAELDIIISVGGMLSKMKLEEDTLEDGEFEFEFPNDLQGDADGNVTVYAIIDDHDEFGNVVQKQTINWGIFNKEESEASNTLWSEAAPIWMYVVLTILLVGVWANYVYTIINLLKIRKEGKQLELNTEN